VFVLGSILKLKNVAKAYNTKGPQVLRDISATISSGDRVALIGANGSGKSTLLKCCIGLHSVDLGMITAFGETFEREPSQAQRNSIRRRTGFVFQKHCLVRRATVLSNVVHGMLGLPGSWRGFLHSTAPRTWRSKAMEALAAVNLADRAMDRADSLSGGQQQRVAIARALVREPELLIADEPAASLDPVAGRGVMSLFSKLCVERGITVVFTSHDMAHAKAFADRVIALKDGRVAFDKPVKDVNALELNEVFDG